jgi:Na+/pantothenate symporter
MCVVPCLYVFNTAVCCLPLIVCCMFICIQYKCVLSTVDCMLYVCCSMFIKMQSKIDITQLYRINIIVTKSLIQHTIKGWQHTAVYNAYAHDKTTKTKYNQRWLYVVCLYVFNTNVCCQPLIVCCMCVVPCLYVFNTAVCCLPLIVCCMFICILYRCVMSIFDCILCLWVYLKFII